MSNYENNFIGRGMNADAFNNTGITNLFISQFAFINETLNPDQNETKKKNITKSVLPFLKDVNSKLNQKF